MIEHHILNLHGIAEHHRRIARIEAHHRVQRRATRPRRPRNANQKPWLAMVGLAVAGHLRQAS